MNKQQRKELAELSKRLGSLSDADRLKEKDEAARNEAIGELENIKDSVQEVADAEEEKFDNLSEGLQNGPTGEALTEAKETLERAVQSLESAIGHDVTDSDWHELVANDIGDAIQEIDSV